MPAQSHAIAICARFLEVTIGFEPMNNAFAERPLKPLEHVTIYLLLYVSVQQTKGFLEVETTLLRV